MRPGMFGLRAKTMVGSLLPIVLSLLLAAVGVIGMRAVYRSNAALDRGHKAIEAGRAIEATALRAKNALHEFALTRDASFLEAYRTALKQCATLFGEARSLSSGESGQQSIDLAEKELGQWRREVADPAIAGRQAAHFSRFTDAVNRYIVDQQTRLEVLRKKASADLSRAEKTIVLLALLVVVAAFVKNYVLAGRTTRPLIEALNLAEAISEGDLRGEVEVTKSDEVGRLGRALNEMVRILKEQTSQILEGISVVSSSTGSISATVSQLSVSTSKTAAAVAETTTTVAQLKQAAQVSSERAKDVARTSQEAAQISELGLRATEETARKIQLIKGQMQAISETVVALNERADAIQGVIATVQDLADQSNLLAVNASIEAARAGEQGKGFAVVAHEIKSLADQSKEATTQVRDLLGQVQQSIGAVVIAADLGAKAVESGVEESSSAGESIRALAARVAESSDAASVIEATSNQQFLGIDQVSVAIRNVEEVMQETLEGTSRLEEAARQLQDLGVQLGELVQRYKV